MISEITKEQWESMTQAELACLIRWVMQLGADVPLPEASLSRKDGS